MSADFYVNIIFYSKITSKVVFMTAPCTMLWINLAHEVPYHNSFSLSFSFCVCPVNTSLTVLMDTKAVLCCYPIPLTNVVLITWEIILRDRPTCKISYKEETNKTTGECTKAITWASRPDVNPGLQIHPVALSHDGYYRCQMATPDGNFDRGYHLQVSGKGHHVL